MIGNKNTEVKISTLIGKSCELTGNFTAQHSVRIDGKIEGDVSVAGSLLLGAGGVINGDISAQSVLIGGEVTGNITALEKTELTATAKVLGDIVTKVIVIDEHAVFQGKCDMNQSVPERRSIVKKAVRTESKSAKAAIAEALKEVEEQVKQERETEAASVGAGKAENKLNEIGKTEEGAH